MAASNPDDDVAQAFVTKWLADVGAGHLAVLVPAGPIQGKLPSPVPVPYCHLEVKKHQDPEYATGGFYIDWREVTLCYYALYADAVIGINAIAAVFEGAAPGLAKTLTVPNAQHMVTYAIDSGHVERDPDMKDGQDVTKGIVTYVVMCGRQVP